MNHWPKKSLGEIATLVRGVSFDKSQVRKEPDASSIPILRAGNIQKSLLTDSDLVYVPKALVSEEQRMQPGDLAICMSSGSPAIVGKTAQLLTNWDGSVGAFCAIVRFGPKFNARLGSYWFKSRAFFEWRDSNAKGANIQNLRRTDLETLSIPVPPLAEQERIAKLLDEADTLRKLRVDADRRTDALIPALFHEMFGVPLTDSIAYPVKKLGALVRDGDKINYGVVQPGDEVSDGIPIVRAGDFDGMTIDKHHLKRISPEIEKQYGRSRLHGDEILISCVGSIGYVALADASLAGFNIVRAVARVPLSDEIDRVFVANQLMTPELQNFFRNETRTVAQPTLNIKQIQEAPIIVPPLALQKEFAARVTEIRAVQADQAISRDHIDALFQSVLHRAFSGKI
jgi:type I restriction enzyme, S subunit